MPTAREVEPPPSGLGSSASIVSLRFSRSYDAAGPLLPRSFLPRSTETCSAIIKVRTSHCQQNFFRLSSDLNFAKFRAHLFFRGGTMAGQKPNGKRRFGFTLVELLVVIGIIALLI